MSVTLGGPGADSAPGSPVSTRLAIGLIRARTARWAKRGRRGYSPRDDQVSPDSSLLPPPFTIDVQWFRKSHRAGRDLKTPFM